MPADPATNATALLLRASKGDSRAAGELLDWLYGELRGLARSQLAGHARHLTQPATALVHEAYLRLIGDGKGIEWANRRQFFAAAAQVMRHIRIDDARRRNRIKRGGGRHAVPIEDEPAAHDPDPGEVLAVHEALEQLEKVDPRKAELVRLRYFAGLSEQETAEVMEVSRRTVQLDWRVARAWLHRELSKGDTDAGKALRHEGT